MTRRRDVRRRRRPRAARPRRLLRAGLHARRQDLGPAPGEGRARRPRREPAHDRRVGRLPRREGKTRRLRRRALLRRLARRPRLRAALRAGGRRGRRRLRDAVRHERRHAADAIEAATAAVVAEARLRRSASTATTTPACGVANSLAAVRAGATMVQGTMNGYGERCGNANLVSIVPNLQLKMGHECLPSLTGLTEAAHFLDELAQLRARPRPAVRGQERLRAQGRPARGRRQRRPGDVRAHRPGRGRQLARGADLRALGRGTVLSRAEQAGVAIDDAAASRVIERVKALSTAASSSRPPTAPSTS